MSGTGTIIDPWDWNTAVAGGFIGYGDTLILRGGAYVDPITPAFSGIASHPITVRAYQDPETGIYERPIFDGSFSVTTDWLRFERIEFMYSGWTTRDSAEVGSAPSDIPIRYANLRGQFNKYIGCIFHDLASVLWYGVGGEMHDCLSFFHGWQGPDRKHGHAYYIHNGAALKRMVNCLGFDSFGYGISLYSGSEPLDNMIFDQVAMFSSGRLPLGTGDNYNLHVGGEVGVSADNISLLRSITYDGLNIRVGYNGGATNVHLVNNIFPEGIDKTNATVVEESGNDYGESGYTDYAKVYPSEEITDQGIVIVCNHVAQAASVNVDVSAVLNPGDSYRLRNARDFWLDIFTGTVAGDGTISIDMQNASHSIATPVALGALPNGFPNFGTFILEKA